jgi:cytochrome b561
MKIEPSPKDVSAHSYGRVAVVFHWALAAALSAQLALGWWMLSLPKSPAGLRAGYFNLHKSIGMTIGLAVLSYLLWRLNHHVIPHASLPAWQRRLARLNHALIYACVVVLPVSGYLGSSFSGYPVRYFGLALPGWSAPWPAAKTLMSAVHETAVWVFAAALVLHVAAALWHGMRRDGIMSRMTSWPNSAVLHGGR